MCIPSWVDRIQHPPPPPWGKKGVKEGKKERGVVSCERGVVSCATGWWVLETRMSIFVPQRGKKKTSHPRGKRQTSHLSVARDHTQVLLKSLAFVWYGKRRSIPSKRIQQISFEKTPTWKEAYHMTRNPCEKRPIWNIWKERCNMKRQVSSEKRHMKRPVISNKTWSIKREVNVMPKKLCIRHAMTTVSCHCMCIHKVIASRCMSLIVFIVACLIDTDVSHHNTSVTPITPITPIILSHQKRPANVWKDDTVSKS